MVENNSKYISYRCSKCNSLIKTTEKYLLSKVCFSCRSSRPKQEKIDIATLSTSIHNLVKQLGRRVTVEDYIKHGKYSIKTVYRLFGKDKWEDILTSLGYKTQKNTYSYQEVVEQLERVAQQLCKLPTLEQYSQIAKIDTDIVKQVAKTNNWVEVLATAFNIPIEIVDQVLDHNHPYYQEQLTKLKTIADKLKRVPTIAEAIKYGVTVDLLIKRLNKKWTELLALAQINFPLGENGLTNRAISKEEMLEDLNLVANQLSSYPSELKYDLLGSYSSANLKYRFDKSWLAVIGLAKTHNLNVLAEASISKEKSCLNKTILEFFDIANNKKQGIDLEKYRF
jgi:hypothetical protein